MTDTITPAAPATPDPTPPAARSPRRPKKALLIGGAVAAALVIGGAVATPSVVHATRVSAYEAAITETGTLQAASHQLIVEADATERLAAMQLSQAHALQGQLAGFAKTPPPALAAEHATQLGKAATSLADALPEATTEQQDTAAAISAAQKDAQGAGFPPSWIGASPDELLKAVPSTLEEPTTQKPIPAAEVTGDDVAEAEQQLGEARVAHEAAQVRLDAAAAVVDDVEGAVAKVLPALSAAAESLPDAAKAVVAAAPKAGDAANGAVTAAAQAAADFATADSYARDESGAVVPAADDKADPVEISEPLQAVLTHRKVKAYLDAAAAAGKAHVETVQREEAEAAAAAAAQAQAEAEAAAAAQWAQQQWSAPAPQYGGGGGYSAPAPAPAPGSGGGGGGYAPPPPPGSIGGCPPGIDCYV
ncbi:MULTISPECIES: hypothetical protein [unclassified Leucobacter]|uniref:hypothetical protein n=1 Tax=unclassified Leucobacter TaxID=2621730 RepID=UPI003018AAD2